jgi:orotidine-5'-phosphate decarboxylase
MNDEYDAAAAVDALLEFSTQTLRIIAPLVPAVKINVAFFEKYQAEGIEAFYALMAEAHALGLVTIADVKRGDVGHAAKEYAAAYLAQPELVGLEDTVTPDAITINPFAGEDGIVPFVDIASQNGKGLFIWVRSSNPCAGLLQDFVGQDGQRFYQRLAGLVAGIANAKERIGQSGYSNVGMIVGGTSPEESGLLRQQYPSIWFLVPGLGAQGATVSDCIRFCRPDGTGALITASRSIIYAYHRPEYAERFGQDWKKAVEQAVNDAKTELARAMGA